MSNTVILKQCRVPRDDPPRTTCRKALD